MEQYAHCRKQYNGLNGVEVEGKKEGRKEGLVLMNIYFRG
jgi:hypothetical protein